MSFVFLRPAGPHRLARPRTSPFHGGNGGSNPPGDAKPDSSTGISLYGSKNTGFSAVPNPFGDTFNPNGKSVLCIRSLFANEALFQIPATRSNIHSANSSRCCTSCAPVNICDSSDSSAFKVVP